MSVKLSTSPLREEVVKAVVNNLPKEETLIEVEEHQHKVEVLLVEVVQVVLSVLVATTLATSWEPPSTLNMFPLTAREKPSLSKC